MSKFQILSLSGGGYMGLYTAHVLEKLEEKFGGPIAQHFDLICGTSIGGIIALGLAFEKPAAQIAAAFREDGEKIFNNKLYKYVTQWFTSKYSDRALRDTIIGILGSNRQLGDALHPIIIPTVNLTKGAPQVFKTPHHTRLECDWKRNPVEIALATSAAPTFFPLAKIENVLYADGGLYANAPDLLGLHEAQHFMGVVELGSVHMLSIGTTSRSFSLGHSSGRNLGRIDWLRRMRLLRVTMSSQQKLVEYMAKHILGDRYFRIDTDQTEEQSRKLALDRADKNAMMDLQGMAEVEIQNRIGSEEMRAFFQHQPQAHKFYYGSRANQF